MISAVLDYAGPSMLQVDEDSARLGLSTNLRRPVRFHARVKDQVVLLRFALQALGEVVWASDMWVSQEEFSSFLLDPIITVHPDRVFFEAFSNDQSTYGLVIAERGLFEPDGEVCCGTTNVDFTSWLWQALADMRSSRPTWFHLGPGGFQVETEGAGGRLEKKVDIPDAWVRGFLQLQAAMALPGTRIQARPVDLLAALRFLRRNKAKTSPRALRYEFEPGQPGRLVLEPWEEVIPLKETEHNYEETRVIRTWGRKRLRLLEPLLPLADSVEIYLKGRALPSFYAARLPGITFLLGLSGWSAHQWTGTGSFDLLSDDAPVDDKLLAKAHRTLAKATTVSVEALAQKLDVPRATANSLLMHLCRQGRTVYDVQRREFRHRELFDTPIDEEKLFPPDPRREKSRRLIAADEVRVESCTVQQTRKTQKVRTPAGEQVKEVLYRDWNVSGKVGGELPVEIVVKDTGQIIFGRCACDFFREHLLNQGPCEHMIALAKVSEPQRRDLPTTTITGEKPPVRESAV
jgi:ribosomal protein S25